MSYCRWSSDDYQCDVYVYEDSGGGWTTHAAGRRRVFAEPLPEPVPYRHDNFEAWFARHQVVSAMCDDAELVDIGLAHDGARFNDPTPGECAQTLLMLREAGYNVPQYAVEALLEEETESVGARNV